MKTVAPAVITNKDMIQSYILTSARYNFSVAEKRIMYSIIWLIQEDFEGKKLVGKHQISKTLWNDAEITIPVSACTKNENDRNYEEVRKALTSLSKKFITYEDEKTFASLNLVALPRFEKGEGVIRFYLAREIYAALLNFTKGFQIYEYQTAMMFDSIFTMRMYELVSNKKKALSYSISGLKEMFQVSDKYKKTGSFLQRVIKVAKDELDEKSPWGFTFEPQYTGKTITSVIIHPKYNPKNRDPKLEALRLKKQVNLSWDMSKEIRDYLRDTFGFTKDEIQRNLDVFKLAQEHLDDLILELSYFESKIDKTDNIKGYIINALKKKLIAKKIHI